MIRKMKSTRFIVALCIHTPILRRSYLSREAEESEELFQCCFVSCHVATAH